MRDMVEEKPRVPLKTILQNFLNHVENLEARKRARDDAYEQEFQSLKAFSDALKHLPEYSSKEGEKEVNRKKNRYKDILPFDTTRVCLSDYPGVPGSDYINANYIKGASGSNAYIASQGPLPNTVNDFWRMVIECEVQVIVMACNEQEAGKYKCENYWNEDENDEKQFGKFFVKLLKSREICPDFLVRTMRLRWTGEGGKGEEERTVCQFHYSAWPDHGVPTQVKPLLEMVRLIRDCQASETLPVLVHCSAGCGRTGTICAIDFIWGLLRTGKLTDDFSLKELVRDMRRQRIAMVQTVEQYMLVHRAVKELFQEQLRVIDSHPYENVDENGRPLTYNEDEIAPDYETIFVKQSDEVHPMNASDIDVILSQRAARNSASPPPPQPPPKQRTPVETGAIETRQVVIPDDEEINNDDNLLSSSNQESLLLYDPPSTNGEAGVSQKIKKGDLRLTQMENGSWRLEDNEKSFANVAPTTMPSSTNVTQSGIATKKDSKKKKSKDSSTPEDSSSTDNMLLRRPSIKKIRALFQKDPSLSKDLATGSDVADQENNMEILSALSKLPKVESIRTSESLSMPNSLDRRVLQSNSQENSQPTAVKMANNDSKSHQPVKRSKSMKVISKPVAFLFSTGSSGNLISGNNNGDETSRLATCEGVSKSENFLKTPKFDFENIDSHSGTDFGQDVKDGLNPLQKSNRPQNEVSGTNADSFRQRISNYVCGKTQPSSSNTSIVNDETKKMIKDCQDYILSSFENAEREGDRLLRTCGSVTNTKNRSAESSPKTTLLKTSSAKQLFSSHSSPSNSYNKYANVNVGGKVMGTVQKSVSSPNGSGSVLKNFCTPASHAMKDEKRESEESKSSWSHHNYENIEIENAEASYVNVTVEAQRKLSAASVSSKSSRERSNSFREAVQGGPSRKQSYEPIWFAGEEEIVAPNLNSGHPVYANASAMVKTSPQTNHTVSMALTERERMGENGEQADYESVIVNAEGRMVPVKKSSRDFSQPLQSVVLVSEVMQGQQHMSAKVEVSPVSKPVLRKQCSNSSLQSSGSGSGAAKGPPPPYKLPPPPPGTLYGIGQVIPSSSKPFNISETANYANVQIHHRESSYISTSKDDSVLSRPIELRPARDRSTPQIVRNRFSCGDFTQQNFTLLNGTNVESVALDGDFKSNAQISALPGVDLDAVAAMMQGGSSRASTNSRGSSNGVGSVQTSASSTPRAFGRALSVLSGAAANIKSRFATLGQSNDNTSSLPTTLPSMMNPSMTTSLQQLPQTVTHGELPPTALPLTVPGAAEASNQQSFPISELGFPQRLDHRPAGPRDPPAHFKRKQEYL